MLSGHVEGQTAEDAGARHPGPAGARDRHVHRLFRTRHGRGAARGRQRGGLRDRRRRRRFRAAVLRRVRPAATRSTSGWGRRWPPSTSWPRPASVFDLVFIDADKAGYLDYLQVVLDTGLLAPHGLICVDNTLMQGQPWSSGEPTANGVAIAEFNQAVAADPRVEQVIIPLRDGLTLIRRCGGLTCTAPPLAADRHARRHHAAHRLGPDRCRDHRPDADRHRRRRRLRELRDLLAEHGVLVLPGQEIDDAAFIGFLGAFGDLTFTAGRDAGAGFPDLNVISNVGRTHAAAQRLPRRHQLRPPPARLHRAARGARSRRRRRDAVHQPVPGLRHAARRASGSSWRAGRSDTSMTGLRPRRRRRDRGRASRLPPAPDLRPHRPLSVHAGALRRDQRHGRRRGQGDDRVPVRALDRARTTPTGIPGRRRRRDVGQRLRAAPGRPRRRRRRPGDAPRHGRPATADRPTRRRVTAARTRLSRQDGGHARPAALALPLNLALTAAALLAIARSSAAPRRDDRGPAEDDPGQRREDDQGTAAGAVVPRGRPPGDHGRVGASTG